MITNIIITFCLLGNLFSATSDPCHLDIFYKTEEGNCRSLCTNYFQNTPDWSAVQQLSHTLYDQTFAGITLNPDVPADQVTPAMLAPNDRHCIGTRRLFQSEEINAAFAQLESILQKYDGSDDGRLQLQAEDVRKIQTQPRTWVLTTSDPNQQGSDSVLIAFNGGKRDRLAGFISSGDTLKDKEDYGLDPTPQEGRMSLLDVKRYIENNS